jgi:hypothetical protein
MTAADNQIVTLQIEPLDRTGKQGQVVSVVTFFERSTLQKRGANQM